jgi:hypothetical protein
MRSQSTRLKEMVASLNDVIEQTYYFEQKVYEWSNKVKNNKNLINKSMGRNDKVDVVIDDQASFRATKVIKTHIDFFPDKLKESLSKELFERVNDKIVTVQNLDGLIKMLKEYGVPPKRFKDFITVKNEVSVEKIDNLIEMGEINIDNIQGCYKVEFEEDIKVTKTK